MEPELEVADVLTIEKVHKVILKNQEILTRFMYESMEGMTGTRLQKFITRDVEGAKRHVYPLFETAKLSRENPGKIVVNRIASEPYCGVFNQQDQTIFAERTVLGCDFMNATYIEQDHKGKVDMYNPDFYGLLSHLMSRARLRVCLGKK